MGKKDLPDVPKLPKCKLSTHSPGTKHCRSSPDMTTMQKRKVTQALKTSFGIFENSVTNDKIEFVYTI